MKIIIDIVKGIISLLVAAYYFIKINIKFVIDYSDRYGKEESEHDKIRHADRLNNKEYGVLKDDLEKLQEALGKSGFYFGNSNSANHHQTPEQREAENQAYREAEPLKAKGDEYEKYIGKQFENNGDLVIYNGFIKGLGDSGVDIIVISPKTKSVNLVQCKNWENRSFTMEEIENIYSKLDRYPPVYSIIDTDDINYYLTKKRKTIDMLLLLEDSKQFIKRKTLYLSSDKVVDLSIGQHLTMMAPNIFKYKDMKMVVKEIS